jgi:predicted nuclease of predicted toxin-antitoxin system
MKLLLDECVSGSTRVFLQEAGHDLITVKELGRASAPNGEILNLAQGQQCVLVTIDHGLGDVTSFPLGSHHGIVVLKIITADDVDPVHRNLRKALSEIASDQLKGALLIVDRNKFRLRRPT